MAFITANTNVSRHALALLRSPGFKPILRTDLRFEPGVQSQVTICIDPQSHNRHLFYSPECRLAHEMDGTYDLDALAERSQLYLRGPATRDEIEQLVIQFAGLGMITNLPAQSMAKFLKADPVEKTGIDYVTFRDHLLAELDAEAEQEGASAALPHNAPIGNEVSGDAMDEFEPTTVGEALTASPSHDASLAAMMPEVPDEPMLGGDGDASVMPVLTDDPMASQLASLRVTARPPQRSWVGTVVTLVILLGVGAGGYVAYGRYKSQIFALQVETGEITEISPVQSTTLLSATGYVVPETSSKIGARVPGRVAKVLVREGDKVKAGDIIARLDDSDQKSALAIARSRVHAAGARARTARASTGEISTKINRERKLVERRLAARADLEDMQAKLRSMQETVGAANAETGAAQAEVQAIKVTLEHMVIMSPISGTVTTKPVSVGELVGPSSRPVAEIADLSSLVVEVDVPERGLDQIKPGSPCEITLDAFSGKSFRGEMKEIGTKVDRAKGTVSVKVKFVDDPERVLPEMAARVSFLNTALTAQAMRAKPKKMLPAAAVVERGGQKVVFVVAEGKVKQTPVTLGPKEGERFQVVEGPAPGSKLVVKVPDGLLDGSAVKEKN
jgi:RND family efflux transporter MFP subunit